MAIPDTIPIIGIPWDDVLFVILAGTMLLSALLVVTLRDIIRCGLAMMVCFAALAGIYVMAGAPLVAAAQVLVYIGAISVLILFAIMLTQTKAAPARLVFQTQAVPGGDRRGGPRRRPRPDDRRRPTGAARRQRTTTDTTDLARPALLRLGPAVRDRRRAPARRGDRRDLPRQARPVRDGRRRMIRVIVGTVLATVFVIGLGMIALAAGGSRSLDAYLILAEPPVRDRDVRLPRPAQRDQHADVDRADAQRRQPLDRRVRLVRARPRAPADP